MLYYRYYCLHAIYTPSTTFHVVNHATQPTERFENSRRGRPAGQFVALCLVGLVRFVIFFFFCRQEVSSTRERECSAGGSRPRKKLNTIHYNQNLSTMRTHNSKKIIGNCTYTETKSGTCPIPRVHEMLSIPHVLECGANNEQEVAPMSLLL